MKVLKILLAILNVFILTCFIIGHTIVGSTRAIGMLISGFISCTTVFVIARLLAGNGSDRTLAIPIIGIFSLFLILAIICVAIAPDKNGMFWVSDEGKFFTRSLNG